MQGNRLFTTKFLRLIINEKDEKICSLYLNTFPATLLMRHDDINWKTYDKIEFAKIGAKPRSNSLIRTFFAFNAVFKTCIAA